ncbi:hypothetical protein BKA67DRAFT_539848 [Truncatella angustata]|uniref:Uncharacterized protein n=1 Tax=Truncatella angustata TaxID=152316 RepID=A0A9P8UDP9_9PEZI|nr:uncharacterized protein BKA67DRAFT_539848 [Truncatella angustata]KAH6648021.1 hypothetical protein BKA67DRAFT_539848 [Truncatella angustata]
MTWVLMAAAIVAASVDSDLGPETCEIKPHALRSGLANFKKRDFSGLMVQEIGYYDELQRRGMGMTMSNRTEYRIPLAKLHSTSSRRPLDSPTTISSNITGSRTSSFDIQSLYFGCLDLLPTNPTGCKVAVAGYGRRGNLSAYQANFPQPRTSPQLSISILRSTSPSSYSPHNTPLSQTPYEVVSKCDLLGGYRGYGIRIASTGF